VGVVQVVPWNVVAVKSVLSAATQKPVVGHVSGPRLLVAGDRETVHELPSQTKAFPVDGDLAGAAHRDHIEVRDRLVGRSRPRPRFVNYRSGRAADRRG
jgi:hypothetical protein